MKRYSIHYSAPLKVWYVVRGPRGWRGRHSPIVSLSKTKMSARLVCRRLNKQGVWA